MNMCYFEPSVFIPQLLEYSFQSIKLIHQPDLKNQDVLMSYSTLKNIFLYNIQPIINRKYYKNGLHELVRFIKETQKLFQASGIVENLDILE